MRMSIEKEYLDIIEEIKQNESALNDWEKGFIFGTDTSSPISERPSLTPSQKKTIEKIHRERVEGAGRSTGNEPISFRNSRIVGTKLETGQYGVFIDGVQVGNPASYRETVSVVAWLSDNIDSIMPASEEEGFPGE